MLTPTSPGLYDAVIRRLSRTTSGGRFIPLIDGLRFIAIGWVFAQHALQTLSGDDGAQNVLTRLLGDSRIGVELFFVISGFILSLPFAQHALAGGRAVQIRAYFLRRLTRLEPPYLLALGLCFAAQVYVFGRSAAGLLPNLVASIFYVHNLIFGRFSDINPVAWSLEVEVQFYCLAPLIALVFRLPRREVRRAVMIGIGVASFGVKHLLTSRFPGMPVTILTHLHYFMAGFVLADIYVADWKGEPARAWAWDAVALGAWIALPSLFLTSTPGISLWVSGLLFVAVYASFRSRAVAAVLETGPIRTLGGMCYSIYLLHLLLLQALGPRLAAAAHTWWRGGGGVGAGALVVAVTLPVFVAFFVLVEKPCMDKDWPRQLAASLRRRGTRFL